MRTKEISRQICTRHIAAGLLAIMLLMASCTPKSRTVDYPLISQANTNTLDIARVELTDSATVLHMDAYFRPKYWIRIAADSYLRAGGQKYMLTGAEGIQPDSLFWMPETGEASFTLYFEPIPMDTRTFDFIESDCEDCFKLYGIDLTGKKDYGKPEGLPKEAASPAPPDSVPALILESGKTTVRIRPLHYLPECGPKTVTLYVNTIFGKQDEYEGAIDPESGEAEISFMQDGTAYTFVIANDYCCGMAWLEPGESADLYPDMRFGRWLFNREYRGEKKGLPEPAPFQRMYTTGHYAGLNHFINKSETKAYEGRMELYSGDFADYRMTSAQYAAHVMDQYKSIADSIAQSDASGLEKEYQTLTLRQRACEAMAGGDYIREHNYRARNNQWDHRVPVEGIEPLKAEDAQKIGTLFDINAPKLMMGDEMSNFASAIIAPGVDWLDAEHLPDGLIKNLRLAARFQSKADNAGMEEADFAMLKAMDTPFFHDMMARKQEEAKKQTAQLGNMVVPTPDVAKEELFEAIIAPHKGKVILVDFWNTWCGPCRGAIKQNEPLKQGELRSDDLVWIYIANETSPLATYMKMIPDIQGIHYRLNEEQWRQLTDKDFDLDGIPSYVVVDKQGHYALRNDLRNHSQLKETLKKALAE